MHIAKVPQTALLFPEAAHIDRLIKVDKSFGVALVRVTLAITDVEQEEPIHYFCPPLFMNGDSCAGCCAGGCPGGCWWLSFGGGAGGKPLPLLKALDCVSCSFAFFSSSFTA